MLHRPESSESLYLPKRFTQSSISHAAKPDKNALRSKTKTLGSGRPNRATRAADSHKNTGPLKPCGPLKVLPFRAPAVLEPPIAVPA